jgi:DNA-binding NarL/FixJ family response regulator
MSEETRGRIRVMLVEDHDTVRQATAFLLDREPDFEVLAQTGTLTEARRLLAQDIEVAIVDLALPDGSGIAFVKDLREFNPEVITLVVTANASPDVTAAALEAGAAAVMHKSVSVPEIAEEVRRLKAG